MPPVRFLLGPTLLLAGWLALGLPALAAPAVVASYAPAHRTLVVGLPHGVMPDARELENPPRFEVDLPGARPARPIEADYASGPVSHFSLATSAGGVRVLLRLRRPLQNAWRLGVAGDRLEIVLWPGGIAAERAPAAVHTGVVPKPLPHLKPARRLLPPLAVSSPAAGRRSPGTRPSVAAAPAHGPKRPRITPEPIPSVRLAPRPSASPGAVK